MVAALADAIGTAVAEFVREALGDVVVPADPTHPAHEAIMSIYLPVPIDGVCHGRPVPSVRSARPTPDCRSGTRTTSRETAVLCGGDGRLAAMSSREIDQYLAALDEPKRSTLETLRQSILEVVPEAEQCISYGMPTFKIQGKTVAGFAAFKRHLSYLPHSGSVLPALGEDLASYEQTKGSLHFPVDKPLPKRLVKKLVTTRMRQLGVG